MSVWGLALALLAAVPTAADSQAPAPPLVLTDPPLHGEQSRRFFEQLASRPLTDRDMAAAIRAVPGASAVQLDDAVEPIFARGERVSGWTDEGLDLRAIMAARAGGTAGNMLRSDSEFGSAVSYYLDRPIEAFIPAEWVLVGRRGTAVHGRGIAVEIGHISAKVILVERISYGQRGRAYCRMRVDSRLYADPDVRATEDDAIAVMTAMHYLARMERTRICQTVIAVGPDGYGAHVFDVEGYRLPVLERGIQPMRIVPFARAQ